jgi:hypothetical protein
MQKLIKIDDVKIGSDPEFFLKSKKGIIPSTDILTIDKYNPINVGEFAVFNDNVLVEGNIPPAKSAVEFISNMKELKAIITDITNCEVESLDSYKFTPEALKSPGAKVFGCSPYINAWKKVECSAANLAKESFRTAGFHIHMGYERESGVSVLKSQIDSAIAKAFDYFCVYPSRLISNDEVRNGNYGEYGSYREKPYGVEVRSLGGYFTKDEYLNWVYNQSIKTIEFVSDVENLRKLQMLTSPKFSKGEYSFLKINLNKQTV